MGSYTHKKIYEVLTSAKKPVFISDERIDGDSVGSALAMAHFMMQHGKKIPVYVTREIPIQYQHLPCIDLCTHDLTVFDDDEIDVVVSFDCSDDQYIKGLLDKIPAQPIVINIDHHQTNPKYGHINQVDVNAPATAEVVHKFFQVNNIIPSRDAATCLLAGLCFDTNMFSNSATDNASLKSASDLVMYGARINDVIKSQFRNRSVGALRVWGLALERLEINDDGSIATFITREDINTHTVDDDEIDGLSNFLNLVTDTDTLHVFKETENKDVKVSMRSRTQDVSIIAKENGGGGHKKAAGYTIENAKLICDESGCWKVEQIEKSV